MIALDSDRQARGTSEAAATSLQTIAKTGNIKTELRAAHITVRNKPHTTLHINFYFACLSAWR